MTNAGMFHIRFTAEPRHVTWLFFSSSSSCLIRVLDHAFIFRNLASDLPASSVFCFACAAKKETAEMDEVVNFKVEIRSGLLSPDPP